MPFRFPRCGMFDPNDDFLTNPNNPTRRMLEAMRRRSDPNNDFLTNPNNPDRRLLEAMRRQSDLDGDFLTSPDSRFRRHLADMHRHHGFPQQARSQRVSVARDDPSPPQTKRSSGEPLMLPPECKMESPVAPACCTCAVCLETLQVGQSY